MVHRVGSLGLDSYLVISLSKNMKVAEVMFMTSKSSFASMTENNKEQDLCLVDTVAQLSGL